MDNFRNPEAEITLIGSILNKNDIIAEVEYTLSPDDFSNAANSIIFRHMKEMYSKGIGIDSVTVASYMKPESLQAVGGLSYLMKANESPATLLNYRDHIREIKKRSISRNLATALSEGINKVKSEDPDDVIQYLQTQIIENHNHQNKTKSTQEVALEILSGEPEPSIPTGFKTLDHVLKGLKRGRVLTIAGRPGTGKSAFSLKILDQLPIAERSIYFTLEMSHREVVERLLAANTLTKLDKIMQNHLLTDSEKEKTANSKIIKNNNFAVVDSSGLNMNSIKARARIEKIKHGLSVIFIDHIGLLDSSMPGMKSYERITEISKGMKSLAKELDVTVIALSQLNRSPDSRNNGEPLLSDLRDSGSVEQDSDQVILLYNPDYQEKSGGSVTKSTGPEKLIAKIAKNRCGGVGKISFNYYKDTQHIEEERR